MYWVDINLAVRKGLKLHHDPTLLFFTKHSQFIAVRNVFGWKLEKSYTRKYMRHSVSNDLCETWPDETIGFRSCWKTNHDRTSKPVVCRDTVTRKVTSNQCWTRWTLTSEFLDCHILLWNRLRNVVFVSSWRRSKSTLTDMLFGEIYNKTKPTTRSVRRQRKWFTTWATKSCLNCSRRILRRSAQNADHTGVKASSIALAGISWKKIVANRGFIEDTLDFFSSPEYVINKGRSHGHRYKKTPEKKENYLAHNLKKRCIKREFTGIHDRFFARSWFS